jgi:hypothetical protein
VEIAALTAFLAPFLPALLKPAQEAATQLAEKFGEAAVDQAKKLWGRLSEKVRGRPAAVEAAEDVAKDPDDPDARTALQWQLKKLLAEDPDFARELAQQWEQAQQVAGINIVVTASGDGSIAVGRDAIGTFSTGKSSAG